MKTKLVPIEAPTNIYTGTSCFSGYVGPSPGQLVYHPGEGGYADSWYIAVEDPDADARELAQAEADLKAAQQRLTSLKKQRA